MFKQQLIRLINYICIFILIHSCEPLDIKRVMDTTTDAVEKSGTLVIAHGTVLDIGESNVLSYGHCWSTAPGATIENFHTDLGQIDKPGEFTSRLFGVIPGLKHYVRSYVFDGAEYIYGDEVDFEITADDLQFNSGKVEQIENGAVNITSSATGIGSIKFDNYGHCWSQTEPPTISDDTTAFGIFEADTSFTSLIENLNMGRYYIRGYLEAEGTIIYTNSVTYESLITLETGVISVNPDNTATAYGKINSLGLLPIIDHGHCWSTTTSSPDLNFDHTSLGSIGTLTAYNSDVVSLVSGRKYYIRAFASDGSKVYYGEIKSFVAN